MQDPEQTRTEVLEVLRSSDDAHASAELLPLVYQELRMLARARLAKVPPGNTLQPTALVHEAYLRILGDESTTWANRGHFFAAAAQAMRQILVDQVRYKQALRHGGGLDRVDVEDVEVPFAPLEVDTLALHQALERLEEEDPRKAQIVLLRYFAGLNREETAQCLDLSVRTVDREWKFIAARLHRDLFGEDTSS